MIAALLSSLRLALIGFAPVNGLKAMLVGDDTTLGSFYLVGILAFFVDTRHSVCKFLSLII
ncbi:MAG: hypothetical protein R3B45_03355 [Bdellovibrionota bacterium]